MGGIKWTAEQDAQLMELYTNSNTGKLSKIIGKSERAIYCRAIAKGLKKDEGYLKSTESGRIQKGHSVSPDTCFKKGHTTWNKGMKGLQMGGKETQFKAGHLPHNTKEDFAISIREDKTGIKYQYIRVSLAKWIPLHRYIWEQANGPIPKGMKLIFKDKDSMNCDVSNLELLTAGQLMKRNSVHNYPKPIAQAVQLRGALNRQINKHIKKFNNEK